MTLVHNKICAQLVMLGHRCQYAKDLVTHWYMYSYNNNKDQGTMSTYTIKFSCLFILLIMVHKAKKHFSLNKTLQTRKQKPTQCWTIWDFQVKKNLFRVDAVLLSPEKNPSAQFIPSLAPYHLAEEHTLSSFLPRQSRWYCMKRT